MNAVDFRRNPRVPPKVGPRRIVPWTGFQLSKLIEKVPPKSEAMFIRFETFNRPDQAPGMAKSERRNVLLAPGIWHNK